MKSRPRLEKWSDIDKKFDYFIITGLYYQSTRRFSLRCSIAYQAYHINLWRGSVWGVLSSGKRKLLKRVFN